MRVEREKKRREVKKRTKESEKREIELVKERRRGRGGKMKELVVRERRQLE